MTKDITVNLFYGFEAQEPRSLEFSNITIYQDVVTLLINNGEKSGHLYNLKGTEVNYLKRATITNLNYVMLESTITQEIPIEIYTDSDTFTEISVPFNPEMTYRDIYNYVVASGVTILSYLMLNGEKVDLDNKVHVDGLNIKVFIEGVIVNLSHRGKDEIFQKYRLLDVTIYQDIITRLIENGELSGSLYTSDNKEPDNYLYPVTVTELDYVISMKPPDSQLEIQVLSDPIHTIIVPSAPDMTYRDIYNYAVIGGEGSTLFLVVDNLKANLSKPFSRKPSEKIFGYYPLPD